MRSEELHGLARLTGPAEPTQNAGSLQRSRIALAVAACSLLAAVPAGATVTNGVPGTTYSGAVGAGGSTEDEYDFAGLNAGDLFQLLVTDLGGGGGGLLLNLYHDSISAGNQIGPQIDLCCSFTPPPGNAHEFAGTLSSSLLILTVQDNVQPCCEGYSVLLTTTRSNGTPEPATLALIGAGLAGALVARRRKRH